MHVKCNILLLSKFEIFFPKNIREKDNLAFGIPLRKICENTGFL